jgi:hypothetical protein
MTDITVITAITGGYDTLLEQTPYPGVEYLAFTDNPVDTDSWSVWPEPYI